MFHEKQIPCKGLFVVDLAEIIDEFCREHDVVNAEVVTHVSNESKTTQHSAATTAATVAQRPKDSAVRPVDHVKSDDTSHAEDLRRRIAGHGPALSRGSGADLHDRGGGSSAESPSMGNHGPARGKAQGQNVLGDCRVRLPVLHVDRQAQESDQRLDKVIPGIRQSLHWERVPRTNLVPRCPKTGAMWSRS